MESTERNDKFNSSDEKSDRHFDDDRKNSDCIGENRPLDENFDLMEFLKKNKESLKDNYGFQQISRRRPPRFYFINNKKSILIIFQGDITRTKIDAIVNAANEHMTGGGGVDGIIHRAAGSELYRACKAHKQIFDGVRLPTGHSRILLSYEMSSTTYHIINTSGPIYYSSAAKQCAAELAMCYQTSLALANLYDLESIGYTAISCGIFGYPAKNGANVALKTVNEYADRVPVVVFVLWDDHIYDAWVDQAEELKFEPFNLDTVTQANTINTSQKDDEISGTKRTKANNDEDKSTTTFNPPVRNFSTIDTPERKTDKDIKELPKRSTEEDIEELTKRLPSVPNDTSDTQKTEEMEVDEASSDPDSKLQSQKTVEMSNVERRESDSSKPADGDGCSTKETSDNNKDKENQQD